MSWDLLHLWNHPCRYPKAMRTRRALLQTFSFQPWSWGSLWICLRLLDYHRWLRASAKGFQWSICCSLGSKPAWSLFIWKDCDFCCPMRTSYPWIQHKQPYNFSPFEAGGQICGWLHRRNESLRHLRLPWESSRADVDQLCHHWRRHLARADEATYLAFLFRIFRHRTI